MSAHGDASVILGLRRSGYSPLEIAAELGIPVSRVEQALRTAGRQVCQQTGKRCFSSVHAARRSMAKAANKVRVYRCEHGPHYHVTSWADGYGGQR